MRETGSTVFWQWAGVHKYRASKSCTMVSNIFTMIIRVPPPLENGRSQCPSGLSLRYAAARLLRMWLRITSGSWMFVVSVVCCQVEVSATR